MGPGGIESAPTQAVAEDGGEGRRDPGGYDGRGAVGRLLGTLTARGEQLKKGDILLYDFLDQIGIRILFGELSVAHRFSPTN